MLRIGSLMPMLDRVCSLFYIFWVYALLMPLALSLQNDVWDWFNVFNKIIEFSGQYSFQFSFVMLKRLRNGESVSFLIGSYRVTQGGEQRQVSRL